jgi:hypothetical protein
MLLTTDDSGGCFLWSAESGAVLRDLSSSCGAAGTVTATQACAIAPDDCSIILGMEAGRLELLSVQPKSPHLFGWLHLESCITGAATPGRDCCYWMCRFIAFTT